MTQMVPTRLDIETAAARVAPHVRVTPVLDLGQGGMGATWAPLLKLELMQHSGSFKARGAFNNLLSRPVGAAGVTAVTGGNHGAAVAFAAAKLGIKARIFVPSYAPAAKVALIRSFGADIEISTGDFHAAVAACDAWVAATGALKVHPFSEPATIAGQGSLFAEWQRQTPLDSVVIAVGGGGLIGGAALWFEGQGVKVVGVEPEGATALHSALAAGGPVEVVNQSIAADSLGAPNIGPLVYSVCAGRVDHVALVSDDAIRQAQRSLWQQARIATEPGGATAYAALQSGAYRPAKGERVGILICGGNVDLSSLAQTLG
jgi:threonine dehydratase